MKQTGLAQVPSRLFAALREWTLIPFVLVTAAAVLSLTHLTVTGKFDSHLPEGDSYYKDLQESANHFLPNDFIMVSVDIDAEDTAGSLARVAEISRAVEDMEGVDRVLSVSTVADITAGSDEIAFRDLYEPADGREGFDGLMRKLEQTPVFREYLISSDMRAFSVYVFPEAGYGSKLLLPEVEHACSRFGGSIHILGKLSVESFIERSVVSDLLLIGCIVLAVILVFEIAVTRSLACGVILWLMTLLPAVWTLGLFPPLGLSLGVDTMLVPIIVLCLSTSYGVQFFRYLALNSGPGIGHALDVTTPVIFGAGLTTIMGFLSLLGSPFAELRILSMMLACGIVLAMAASFFLLPILFSRVRIPVFTPFAGSDTLARLSTSAVIPLIFAGVMAALLLGFTFIRSDYRLEKILSSRTELSRTIGYFYEKYGGVNEIEIVVDSGRDGGIVDPGFFRSVRALREDLLAAKPVSHVLSYTELVDWVNGRLTGEGREPLLTESTIGESLELLGYGGSGLGIGSLTDAGYRRAKIIVRFGSSASGARDATGELSGLLAAVDAAVKKRLGAVEWTVIGDPVMSQRLLGYLMSGQVTGALIYFVLLFLYAVFFFRSWRWALLAMLPPLSGLVFFLGAMGWAQVPLTHAGVTAIAAIMGVGVDDVLCLLIYYRNNLRLGSERAMRETFRIGGSAIIQTTSIIVLALQGLLLSNYTVFVQIALLAGLSFIFCTSVTIFVVPSLVRRFGGRHP